MVNFMALRIQWWLSRKSKSSSKQWDLLTQEKQDSGLHSYCRRTSTNYWSNGICRLLWWNSCFIVGELSDGTMGLPGLPMEMARENLNSSLRSGKALHK
jgi:hypothetical protein